jgi:DNA-binding transcriptional LysR family regulator
MRDSTGLLATTEHTSNDCDLQAVHIHSRCGSHLTMCQALKRVAIVCIAAASHRLFRAPQPLRPKAQHPLHQPDARRVTSTWLTSSCRGSSCTSGVAHLNIQLAQEGL